MEIIRFKGLSMAEGLFHANQFIFPEGLNKNKILFSVVKIRPLRNIEYQVFNSKEEAESWSDWITNDDGTEVIKYGATQEDIDQCSNQEFSQALLNFEFCEAIKNNKQFPLTTPLQGTGTGVLISSDGHILTNFHLASGIITSANREAEKVINSPIKITGLEVEIAISLDDKGELIYRKCKNVYLISNPSKKEAYGSRLDLTLLKVDLQTDNFISLCSNKTEIGEKLVNVGFTMRTARSKESKRALNYEDANYDLRLSSGVCLEEESENSFLSDVDGGPGNSGSATLNSEGELVGLYFGSTGNCLMDFSKGKRRHVYSKSIKEYFNL